ncbi:hypothetical protein PENTCL1PPCAC_30652, partial [Pristionchus entomophagus]
VYRKAPILDIPLSAAFCSGFLHSFIALGGPLYFSLFIYRHQAITPAGSRFKFARTTQLSFLAVLLIPY